MTFDGVLRIQCVVIAGLKNRLLDRFLRCATREKPLLALVSRDIITSHAQATHQLSHVHAIYSILTAQNSFIVQTLRKSMVTRAPHADALKPADVDVHVICHAIRSAKWKQLRPVCGNESILSCGERILAYEDEAGINVRKGVSANEGHPPCKAVSHVPRCFYKLLPSEAS
jgi:hypothetical protein